MTIQLHHGKRNAPRRILLYAVHGIGKSTWASMADAPIFIATEDGLADIDCTSFPLCENFDQFLECLTWLYSQPHEFRTVVIDTADWLERLIWQEVCKVRNVESIDEIDFQKGYQFALTYWSQVIAGLKALQRDRGMHVIVLAHSKSEKFKRPGAETYDRYAPKLHKEVSAILQEWATEVLFANYKLYTKTSEEGFGNKRAIGVGGGDRVLYTSDRAECAAKNRLGLPDELPLDYREFAKHLPSFATAA